MLLSQSNLLIKTKLFSYTNICALFSTKHKIIQIKNNSMLIVEDNQQHLPYMSEIETKQGYKGIVMKIQQGGHSYIGMYDQINNMHELEISKINKTWKESFRHFVDVNNNVMNGIYDVNGREILKIKKQSELISEQNVKNNSTSLIVNGNKRRVRTASPVINTCYDLYYGDMISFLGCRGSRKSQTAFNIVEEFQNDNKALCIYINPSLKQSNQLINRTNRSMAFSVQHGKKPTDIGVYMLTLKAINLSVELKNKGKDVLLVIDNLNDIMLREWSLLQTIKFNSKTIDSSKLFQYNTLKIAPVSLLNEIYSNCEDQTSQSNKSSVKKGSLTSILISEKQNNQLMQEISHYSNNIKHLQTLSKVLEFPIDFQVNSNLYAKKINSVSQNVSEDKSKQNEERQLYTFMRNHINEFLRERSETDLKRSLYKNDLRDAPWDYFFLLDSEWWSKDYKNMSFNSYAQTCKFLQWTKYNIQHELVGQWNIKAKQSFNKFITYLKNQRSLPEETKLSEIQFTKQEIEQFLQESKMQGSLSPFKKDYLL